ncbi:MAG TPA: bifunctional phosphoglucose/phosphomannose isomerase [Candidatus Nanoarchaeia archaeon]|nr:bifunctional phosphoglucose/phosphomannose isomerase [Candidatus Nanoarchaeia archaeon]
MKETTKKDMLYVLDTFWNQCEEALALAQNISVEGPLNGIVISGMGGSAIPGDILQGYADLKVPVVVNRDYSLPAWVTKQSLVFLISYSGNTEETVACFNDAKERGAKIVGISSGGKIEELCLRNKVSFVKVPSGYQPRDATGYLSLPIITVLKNSGIITVEEDEFKALISTLKKDVKETAKSIAKKMKNKIVVVYSSQRLACLARTWKSKINENAKTQAFYNSFPELNHNEMVGFTKLIADYFIVMIEEESDHVRIKKRMDITKRLLQDAGCSAMVVNVSGRKRLANIFYTILLGSYVGYYLAEEYGIDPAPVVMVEDLKKELSH